MARSENNLTAVFTDTANAIRSKTGTSALIEPRDFADNIESIEVGEKKPLTTIDGVEFYKVITSNDYTGLVAAKRVIIATKEVVTYTEAEASGKANIGISGVYVVVHVDNTTAATIDELSRGRVNSITDSNGKVHYFSAIKGYNTGTFALYHNEE